MIILNHLIRFISRFGDDQSINNNSIRNPKKPSMIQEIFTEKISEVLTIISITLENAVFPPHSDSSTRYLKKAVGDNKYNINIEINIGRKNTIVYDILSFQDLIVVKKKGKRTMGYIFSANEIPSEKAEMFSLFLNKNKIEIKLKRTTTDS
jgi:hypothetical protein